ncbi:hypothetical protein BHE74_00056617 [Ensete ventricosum]|nr:hypothetical protein GW17_00036356 [Ensete ventricosum]RWW38173.1 hypothetical protein BHE74_00056617 [Ensete ventricosum]RZR93428.1 hypothetical protein BHM03_00021944 [Ensete ventricosum]
MLYILHIEAKVSPRSGSAHIHMGAQGFFVGTQGMCRLLEMSVGRSGTQAVASCWSRLLVLDRAPTARVCCDVLWGVAYPRSGDFVWLSSMGGDSLFASVSFHSSTDIPVVDVYTKTVVGGRCHPG